jgi:hypothetical protein
MFVLMVDPPSNIGRHMFVLMVDPLIFRTFTGRTDQSAPVVRYPSKESMRRCYK